MSEPKWTPGSNVRLAGSGWFDEDMKPDWKDAPEWAKWLAMDADGHWYWFEGEPKLREDCWRLAFAASGRYRHAGCIQLLSPSREPRPEPQS